MYSANRVKYPLVRSRLLKLWRKERAIKTPVGAWAAIQEDPQKRAEYIKVRGLGGFVRGKLGRGQRDHRRGQRLYGEEMGA